MDDTAATLIGRLIDSAAARQTRQFVIAGLTGDVEHTFKSMGYLGKIPQENFVANMDEARAILKTMLLKLDADHAVL